MKYNINNKMIFLVTLSSFVLSGCVTKNEVKSTPIVYKKFSQKINKSWEKRENSWKKISKKDDDCINCYATNFSVKKRILPNIKVNSFTNNEVITYDYSKAPTEQVINNNYYESERVQRGKLRYAKKAINTLHYGAYDYTVIPADIKPKYQSIKVAQRPRNIYTSNGAYVSGTSIQVGAFRHYLGAKRTARKYDLLSSKYSVKIESSLRGNSPIHRVRIEGFNSKREAKNFMSRYSISDAFLVRR